MKKILVALFVLLFLFSGCVEKTISLADYLPPVTDSTTKYQNLQSISVTDHQSLESVTLSDYADMDTMYMHLSGLVCREDSPENELPAPLYTVSFLANSSGVTLSILSSTNLLIDGTAYVIEDYNLDLMYFANLFTDSSK